MSHPKPVLTTTGRWWRRRMSSGKVCWSHLSYSTRGILSSRLTKAMNHRQPGDPEKCAEVIVDVVRGEGSASGKPFPLSLPLGSDAYGTIKEVCENMTEQLGQWKDVICSTDLPKNT
ncbi:hypothetical protein PHLCEN_2v13475 [Hermanssonia centrifuga]|uniref:Uncharacterized protein n=1 Tax=Hermanssonia centrifuga TaxID=98765 RepID=A0A2R6NE55_9APHY|nr:hypothetical protein PHLCEN_2v13475 [Hermanssonia centrifuga]